MTEEQKQALVERLIKFRGDIMSARDAGMATRADEMDDRIAEIALAALTAQPVKLPDRYDIASMIDVEKDDDGPLYLREDVIDAIRAAGCEVQE